MRYVFGWVVTLYGSVRAGRISIGWLIVLVVEINIFHFQDLRIG
jgi:hypothetical protein